MVDIILIVIAVALIALSYYVVRRSIAKDASKRISGMRDIIEGQLYDASDRLTSNANRFIDANQLIFSGLDQDLKVDNQKSYNNSFFSGLGIDKDSVAIEHGTAALLMPFNNRYQKQCQTIKDACQSTGYDCRRSDDSPMPGNLLKQIVAMILKSQIIIALIDGRNPNVFYEIGLAHSLGKPVILVASAADKNDMPFDISSDRLLLYDNLPDLREKMVRTLKHLRNA